jgi:hypothetical protein
MPLGGRHQLPEARRNMHDDSCASPNWSIKVVGRSWVYVKLRSAMEATPLR